MDWMEAGMVRQPDRQILRHDLSGPRVERGPWHWHEDFEVTWVEAGHLTFELDTRGSPIDAAAGACIVVPPGVAIRPRVRAAVMHQIAIPRAAVEAAEIALGQDPPGAPEPRLLGFDDRLAQLIRVYMQEAESGLPAEDPSVAALSNAVVYGLARAAGRTASAEPARDRRIRRALEAMASGYRERLSVDDLAAAARMGRSSFLRAFRSHTGKSPYQYLTELRLDRAAERFRAVEAPPVLEVALACGFTDPGRFARAFRARFGCLPRAYGARLRP